jgi:hypothetical protein
MDRRLYALGLLLLGAVFGVLAATLMWPFVIGAVVCFVFGFLIERGILTWNRLDAALPFEVRRRQRGEEPRTVPPLGILDWELAFEREGKAIQRTLEEVTRSLTAISALMQTYGPRFETTREAPVQARIRISQEFAREARPHARRMERAERGFRKAIESFSDNYLRRIKAYPPDENLAPLRPSVVSLRDTTNGSLASIRGYRDAVRTTRGINLERTMNELLDQLARTADRLVDDTEKAVEMAEAGLNEIDGRASTVGVNRAERRRRGRSH